MKILNIYQSFYFTAGFMKSVNELDGTYKPTFPLTKHQNRNVYYDICKMQNMSHGHLYEVF